MKKILFPDDWVKLTPTRKEEKEEIKLVVLRDTRSKTSINKTNCKCC